MIKLSIEYKKRHSGSVKSIPFSIHKSNYRSLVLISLFSKGIKRGEAPFKKFLPPHARTTSPYPCYGELKRGEASLI